MIVKANEINFNDKKLSVIVAGVAGVGKTTLALSAPDPLLIDLENGVGRVEARHRKDTDVVTSYEELMHDLNGDLSAYKTIVIDTGGKLLEFLKPVVINENPKNGQSDGSLSLKGYGAVKRKFSEFINFVKSKDKHLVVIFHATEVQLPNDIIGLRIRIEGSSRDEVWDDMDLGGFIEMRGNKRVLSFQNCDRFYAKRTYGVAQNYAIPELNENTPNTFLTDLFNEIINKLNAEGKEITKYQNAIKLLEKVKSCNREQINDIYGDIKTTEHALTSKEELWYALNQRAKELGCKYDKASDRFE